MNKIEVLKLVKKNGLTLKKVSKELRSDKEVIVEAVRQNPIALYYISDELKQNKEMLYMFKNYLTNNKIIFSLEYELLMRYEREDALKETIDDKDQIKIRRKI